MNKRIVNEAIRAFGSLEQMDPQDVDVYSKLVDSVQGLVQLSMSIDEDWNPHDWYADVQPTAPAEQLPGQTRIEEVLADEHPVTESPFPEPEPAPKTEPVTFDRVALRKRLATAQKNGINVAKIVSELGATGFTKLPDEKLPALDEALKELGY